MHIAYL